MPERFFSKAQKVAAGLKCAFEVDHAPCEGEPVEGDHMQPFFKGGETTEDNLLNLCLPHHVLKHMLDGETWIARLMMSRMTPKQLAEYYKIK